MRVSNLDIGELILRQFGNQAASLYKRNIQTRAAMKGNATSRVGTPVYDTLTIKGGKVEGSGQTYAEYVFPDVIMMELSRVKNIVKTKLDGADGTVKELISMEDYMISLKGFIINYDSDEYPHEEISKLRNILEVPAALQVVSPYLCIHDIDFIVIEEFKFPLMEGYSHVQPFEISASADIQSTLESLLYVRPQ